MISESRGEGNGEEKNNARELKLYCHSWCPTHTHTFAVQRESHEKRAGLELYSLFIALLPFILGLIAVHRLAIVAVSYVIIASKQSNKVAKKVNQKQRHCHGVVCYPVCISGSFSVS